MGTKEMMLALPEVRALTDKIPAAELFIEPNEVQLRYFQNSAEEKRSLREQCEHLGMPWAARKIGKDRLSMHAVEVARDMEPSLYSQAAPEDPKEFRDWIDLMHNAPTFRHAESARWYTLNALEAPKPDGTLRAAAIAYDGNVGPIHKGTSVKRVVAYGIQHIRISEWERTAYELQRMWARHSILGPYYHRPLSGPPVYKDELIAGVDFGDLTFCVLDTLRAFVSEARRMHHCVDRYFERQQRGGCHIVSVSTGNKPLYTVEYSSDWRPVQIKGPCNKPIKNTKHLEAIEGFGTHAKSLMHAEVPDQPDPLRAATEEAGQRLPGAAIVVDESQGQLTINSVTPDATKPPTDWVGPLLLAIILGSLTLAMIAG
ncbi:MAG: PcfJ domain-containing protein [Roseibium sp.]|nr:PcfJ domain-containing protein [Roseibium sp.]